MKLLFISLVSLLFLAPIAKAQKSIIGNNPQAVMGVVKEVSDLFNIELRRGGDPFSMQKIQYMDSLQFYRVTIHSTVEKIFEGTAVKYGQPEVSKIIISTPENQILKLFNYFQEKYKSYPEYKSRSQFIQFENVNIYWQTTSDGNSNIPMAALIFEKKP